MDGVGEGSGGGEGMGRVKVIYEGMNCKELSGRFEEEVYE